MDDFINNLRRAFDNDMKHDKAPAPKPETTETSPEDKEPPTGTEENYEVVPPHDQASPEGSGTETADSASDNEDYDSDRSEWESVDAVIKTMFMAAGGLLLGMMFRDYGLFVPTVATVGVISTSYLSKVNTFQLMMAYGKVRQKIDHGLDFVTNICKNDDAAARETIVPESTEENIMMIQFKPDNDDENADNEDNEDDDEGPSWSQDSVVEHGLLFMITREDRKGTLKVRFKTGQTRTIKLNA